MQGLWFVPSLILLGTRPMSRPARRPSPAEKHKDPQHSWRNLLWIPLLLAFLTPLLGGLAKLILDRLSGQPNPPTAQVAEPTNSQPSPRSTGAAESGRVFRNSLDLLTTLACDLEKAGPDLRSGRRYLDLYDLNNDRSVSAADLERTRSALGDLSSWFRPGESVFQAIDSDRLVFAFDLGKLGWTDDRWQRLLASYPYGMDLTQARATSVRDKARQVADLTPSKLPCIRATWFLRRLVRAHHDGEKDLALPSGAPPAAVQSLEEANARLTLARAAAELGLSDPQELHSAIQSDPRLRQKFGLGPLAEGGTIARDTWEARPFTTSAFQESARRLELGTPVLVQ
jgi:hypothetical protein